MFVLKEHAKVFVFSVMSPKAFLSNSCICHAACLIWSKN